MIVNVATSSDAVLVLPEVAPRVAPDMVSFVRNTVIKFAVGALLPEDKVIVALLFDDWPITVTSVVAVAEPTEAILKECVELSVAPLEVKLATSPLTAKVTVPFCGMITGEPKLKAAL